jgi:hypothetical protein
MAQARERWRTMWSRTQPLVPSQGYVPARRAHQRRRHPGRGVRQDQEMAIDQRTRIVTVLRAGMDSREVPARARRSVRVRIR